MSTAVLAAEDPREIVLRSVPRNQSDIDLSRQYTYLTRTLEKQLDKDGKVKSTESKTYDVANLYGQPYRRLVARDGKPLPAKEESEEQKKMDKELGKRSRESEADRRKREKELRERLEDQKKFIREIADAFEFKLLGTEGVDGHDSWVIEAEPKRGFKPVSRRGGILARVRGKLWITRKDYRWVKLEADVIDTISFGWMLLRLHKGTRMTFEQRRVGEELWMPSHAWIRGGARVALVKNFRIESETWWENYRKFQTDSRVVGFETQ
ncbi:MAG: hypothetical protein FJW20_16390 [Acidimicrobiia bacterium]|nr:hypothetical protein [Acidimicrobiia bacterium]